MPSFHLQLSESWAWHGGGICCTKRRACSLLGQLSKVIDFRTFDFFTWFQELNLRNFGSKHFFLGSISRAQTCGTAGKYSNGSNIFVFVVPMGYYPAPDARSRLIWQCQAVASSSRSVNSVTMTWVLEVTGEILRLGKFCFKRPWDAHFVSRTCLMTPGPGVPYLAGTNSRKMTWIFTKAKMLWLHLRHRPIIQAYNPYPFMNPIVHRTTVGRYFPDRTPGFRNVVES